MDETEDDARYPPNPYSTSHRPKLPVRNTPYTPQIGSNYEDDDEDEEVEEQEEEVEEEEEESEGEEENGVRQVVEEADNDEDDEDEDDEDDDDENDEGEDVHRKTEADEDSDRHRKKKKLKNLAFSYEFAPRVTTPSAVAASAPKPATGGARNSPADWSEYASFVLLDSWGDRFLQLGRKSLRSEDWHGVARKVSQASKTVRTETQCRNRLDTLKKKYKKEKMKLAEAGDGTSKWVYFKKLDFLLTPEPKQPGLSCGVDSGDYVFMNPKGYSNSPNGLDEMKDSPGNSGSSENDEDDSDGLPPKRTKVVKQDRGGSSIRLLADSIQKFGEIYEKIENSKREQMLELEKMRMEFHRDLESQKRLIMERAQAEIVKIRQGDDEDNDASTENFSG